MPVFEGWYRNQEGRLTLQFGYFSRNTAQRLDIPLGPDNFIVPAEFDGAQPTHFLPQPKDRGPGRGIRHWGVFTVTVPDDFGGREVVWTLRSGGDTVSVPGHFRSPDYELNARGSEASGTTPPTLRFSPGGAEGSGPTGVRAERRFVQVGVPLDLKVFAEDEESPPVVLRWFQHQGPGAVVFSRRRLEVDSLIGQASTKVTFAEPGHYVLRVRATNADTEFDRYCCWTNGYVDVTVYPDSASVSASTSGVAEADQGSSPVTPGTDVASTPRTSCHGCRGPGSMPPRIFGAIPHKPSLMQDVLGAPELPSGNVEREAGVQEFNDGRGLTDRGIDTIPTRINPAASPVPAPRHLLPSEATTAASPWSFGGHLGPPDLIVESEPYPVPKSGQDEWWTSVVDLGLDTDRWVRAVEVTPADSDARRVAHHAVLYQLDSQGRRISLLTEWATGKIGEIFPENTGRRLKRGAKVEWDLHFVPAGERVPGARVRVGLWFYPNGFKPRFRNRVRAFRAEPTDGAEQGAHIDIPPGQVTMTRGVHSLAFPARIESFQPHMHKRGSAMSMEAVYPDGHRVTLSRVDRFEHEWHVNYMFADHVMPLLPAGTSLVFTAWHDNTAENPDNPDPRQWVGFGRRLVDEMAHAWVSLTTLTEEQYKELLEEREGTADHSP